MKHKYVDKLVHTPVKNITSEKKMPLKKPLWIKIKFPSNYSRIQAIKETIRKNGLFSVCEEASCPNISKCFDHGSVTFMILGKICTRRCPFCNVSYGRPAEPDVNEPEKIANVITEMQLTYVVITSVNRDDLRDGGAQHFANCISSIRKKCQKNIKIEILVPDFRHKIDYALKFFKNALPDVFSHNLENVPRLYPQIRPGANYNLSLKLLKRFKEFYPEIRTKSGLMVGLGETNNEIIKVMYDLRQHGVSMLTIGQYLQPSRYHLPVQRYLSIDEFKRIKLKALEMGFTYSVCGPFVRSSYYADLQEKYEYIN